jgi:hypothetical protein
MAIPFPSFTPDEFVAFANYNCPWLRAGKKCSWEWANSLSDVVFDSFERDHGDALDRYTCWEQYRQKRFENAGSRLDYIFVDHDLPIRTLRPLYGCLCGMEFYNACTQHISL